MGMYQKVSFWAALAVWKTLMSLAELGFKVAFLRSSIPSGEFFRIMEEELRPIRNRLLQLPLHKLFFTPPPPDWQEVLSSVKERARERVKVLLEQKYADEDTSLHRRAIRVESARRRTLKQYELLLRQLDNQGIIVGNDFDPTKPEVAEIVDKIHNAQAELKDIIRVLKDSEIDLGVFDDQGRLKKRA